MLSYKKKSAPSFPATRSYTAGSCSRKNKFNRLPTHQASEIIKIATQETQKEKSNAKIARIRRSNPPTNNASSARLSKASNSGGHDIFVVQSSSGGSCFEQDCAWQHRQACARHDQDDDVQP
jgi:hypothetical protein